MEWRYLRIEVYGKLGEKGRGKINSSEGGLGGGRKRGRKGDKTWMWMFLVNQLNMITAFKW